MSRRFSQVDVFSDRPLLGNPVAVVHVGAGPDGTTWVGGDTRTTVSGTVALDD